MSNPALENSIGGQADHVPVVLRLQEFVDLGRGKTRIGPEVGAPFLLAVGWAHAGEPPGVSRTEQRFGELRLGSPRARREREVNEGCSRSIDPTGPVARF